MVTAFVFHKLIREEGDICQEFIHCFSKRIKHQINGRMRFHNRLHLCVDICPEAIRDGFVSIDQAGEKKHVEAFARDQVSHNFQCAPLIRLGAHHGLLIGKALEGFFQFDQ